MNGHEDLICCDRILVLIRPRVLLASGEISPSLDLTGARSTGTGCERFFFFFSEFGGEKKFRLIQVKNRKRVGNKQTSSELFTALTIKYPPVDDTQEPGDIKEGEEKEGLSRPC